VRKYLKFTFDVNQRSETEKTGGSDMGDRATLMTAKCRPPTGVSDLSDSDEMMTTEQPRMGNSNSNIGISNVG